MNRRKKKFCKSITSPSLALSLPLSLPALSLSRSLLSASLRLRSALPLPLSGSAPPPPPTVLGFMFSVFCFLFYFVVSVSSVFSFFTSCLWLSAPVLMCSTCGQLPRPSLCVYISLCAPLCVCWVDVSCRAVSLYPVSPELPSAASLVSPVFVFWDSFLLFSC